MIALPIDRVSSRLRRLKPTAHTNAATFYSYKSCAAKLCFYLLFTNKTLSAPGGETEDRRRRAGLVFENGAAAVSRHMTLLVKTGVAHLVLLIAMALLAFGPNPSVDYREAWVFLPLFVGASLAVNLYLLWASPDLLARRLSIGPIAERETAQRIIMLLILLGAVMLVALPALDHRMNGSALPPVVPAIGNLLTLFGWLVFFLVFRENAFASATVEISPDQKVIATGPYGWVRHPMYSGAALMLVGVPLALGSWWGLPVSAAMILTLVVRIHDEERFLRARLPGYVDYQRTNPYRLFRGVW